ncbi:type I polyketide synthase [Corynebacterium massiliense]|uniref:type I polyketide synthase n=1 Tax=Corynebacterium massiliense TaxID=441501 RepID=UPI002355FD77|nr:type I polyketide synthase [Corynebacterium massiliense]
MGRAEFTRPGFILTFAGQGSHWQPVLREWLDHPDGETLRADIAAADGILGALATQLPSLELSTDAPTRPAYSTPGILLVQLATLDSLAAQGFPVDTARGHLGHSQGVLAQAAAAGELTRPQAVALARLIGAAIEKVASVTGLHTTRDGAPMRAVMGCAQKEVEGAIAKQGGDEVYLGLTNARDEHILTGPPAALNRVDQALPEHATVQPLRVDAAFHHPAMRRAVDMVDRWVGQLNNQIPAATAARLARAVLTDVIDWPRALRGAVAEHGAGWVLEIGPGTHLTVMNEKVLAGRGVGTLAAGTPDGQNLLLTPGAQPRQPRPWAAHTPRVEHGRVITRLTEVTGYPPVLLAGMTPGTVDPAIVAAAANAGYWAELAGGGQHTLAQLEGALATLHDQLDDGVNAQFNALYLDAKRWREQITGPRGIVYQRRAGAPINGVVVSAGIPPREEAIELVRRLKAAAIPWVAFKPGTARHVETVLALADALPNQPLILQLEGGQAGGHHSWQGLEDTLAETYGAIRARDNVLLVVGGGIGTPERAAEFLTGTWAEDFDLPAAPVDGVLIGTAALTARESTASPAVKQALVDTPGTSEWIAPGTAAGGVSAGRSQFGADLYELDNAWGRAGRLLGRVTRRAADGDADAIDRARDEIIAALAETAKPYFGDIADMTYAGWLRRYVELSFFGAGDGDVGERVLHPWVDESWAARFVAMLARTEARLTDRDDGEFPLRVAGRVDAARDPEGAIATLVQAYPAAAECTVHPADRHWFIEFVRGGDGAGKPPGFVPVIDADVHAWWRRDSLWQAHDPRYGADAVCAIPGPVAVGGVTRVDEPVADILRRFEDAAAARLAGVKEASHRSEDARCEGERPSDVVRRAPVLEWAGRPRVNPVHAGSAAVVDAAHSADAESGAAAALHLPAAGPTGELNGAPVSVPVHVDTALPAARPPRVSREAALSAMREWARRAAGGVLPEVRGTDRVAEWTATVGPECVTAHALAVTGAATRVDALVGLAWPAIYAVLADREDLVVDLPDLLHAEHRIDVADSDLGAFDDDTHDVTATARIRAVEADAAARRVTVAVSMRAAASGRHRELARLEEVFVLPGRGGTPTRGDESASGDALASDASYTAKPRSFVHRATVRAPRDMREFALATGDMNPLHLADPGAIVHGMWTSAAAQSVVQEATQEAAPAAVRDWYATFLAPVHPGDDVTVTVERVGVDPRPGCGAVLSAHATVAGEPVLEATATLSAPVTFYAFPGQGIQHRGMGMGAFGASASARAVWERADRHTRDQLGFSVLHIVRANPRRVRVASEDFTHPDGVVNLTQFTQVAMAVLAYAQVEQLREEGVLEETAYFAGHSVGEYTALAAFAGVLSLEAVIDVVYRRGLTMYRLVSRDADGNSAYAMAALRPHKMAPPPADAAAFVAHVADASGEFLEVVNHNVAGRQYAVAGTRAGIAALEAAAHAGAARADAVVRIPGLDVPFHSSRLLGGVDDFRAHLEELIPADVPATRLVGRYIPNLVARPFALDDDFLAAVEAVVDSPVIAKLRRQRADGTALSDASLARTLLIELLAWQFASPVRWIETQELILGQLGVERFIEVGVAQSPTLANMLGQTLRARGNAPDGPEVLNVERDAERVFATDVVEAPDTAPDDAPNAVPEDAPDAVPGQVPDAASDKAPQEAPAELPAPADGVADRPADRPADNPLSVDIALHLLAAVWTDVRPDQIAATDSIETLVDGVSSRRNQLLLDVSHEFGIPAIDGAADLSLAELAEAIAARATGYRTFGPVLRATTAATLAGISGPAGKKPGEAAQRVTGAWELGDGWADRVIAELTAGTRAGSSVRGGQLATLTPANPASAAELGQLIDAAVEAAGERAGVAIPRPRRESSGEMGQVGIGKQQLASAVGYLADAMHTAVEAGAEELAAKLAVERPGRGRFDGDARAQHEPVAEPDAGAETEADADSDAQVAAAARRELGSDWMRRVEPIFDEQKVVVFDDRWASAREDLVRLAEGCGRTGRERDPDGHDREVGSFVALGEDVAAMAEYLAGGAGLPVAEAHALADAARRHPTDLPFDGCTAVVTGASPNSIAAAVVAELLAGGARVIETTSRWDAGRLPGARRGFYRELYRRHAAGRASLEVVPGNLSSFADVDALAGWLDARGESCWALFPFAAPPVAGTLADAGSGAEAQMRVLVWSVERLIAKLARAGADAHVGERLHVVLPGSPNRGLFGGDGAYGEAKAAFDALVARWAAEPDWAGRVALVHAHIGWVRGTGLMGANDDLVGAARRAGIAVSEPAETASRLVGYLADADNRARMAQHPQTLDLTGGLRAGVSLRELRAEAGSAGDAEQAGAEQAQEPTARALPSIDDGPLTRDVATAEAAAEFTLAGGADARQVLADMVVIVGGGELGACGSSRTRWQVESTGDLTAAGVIELAWSMGLIHFDSDRGWIATTGEGDAQPIAEKDIAARFHDEVLARSGVRRFTEDFGPVAPMVDNLAPELSTVYLDRDMTFEVADEAAAREFAAADPRVRIAPAKAGETGWQVTRPKGSAVRVPKRVTMSRVVGGAIPDGFDPGVYGIPPEMLNNVDRAAVWNLVCTVEAFVSAGFTPGELLRCVHPAQVASTQGTGMGGVESLRALYVNGLLGEARQNEVLQETLPNIIAAHVMQDYVGGYGAQHNPVGACATAAVSVEQASDLLRLRKADFVVAGAVDDLNAETITGFGDMGATADSGELAARGIEERYYSRPNDRRRAGFVDAAGGGTVLLTRGDVAADLGLPVTAVVGFAGSFADGLHASVPAPGRGLLAAARGGAARGGDASPLARGLAQLGVGPNDIAVVSKHDTSTPVNDPHESELHEDIAAALGRDAGNPLCVVSQKALTGHAKGGAAAFQVQGLSQILATGIIPPNRSLDCVDPELRRFPHLTWLRRPLERGGAGVIKCGLISSLGFGHISALLALVHPAAFRAALAAARGESAAEKWAQRATDRQRVGARRRREAMYGGPPLYRRPRATETADGPERAAAEKAMLLDAPSTSTPNEP